MKCAICGDEVDTENPFMTGGVYGKNPITWRMAWMHGYCLENAIDDTKTQPAKSIQFENRHDEYVFAVQ